MNCKVPDCGRPADYGRHGYCRVHYNRMRNGNDLNEPIIFYRKVVNGFKQCSKCEKKKRVSEFYSRTRNGHVTPSSACKECSRAYQNNRMAMIRQERINETEGEGIEDE